MVYFSEGGSNALGYLENITHANNLSAPHGDDRHSEGVSEIPTKIQEDEMNKNLQRGQGLVEYAIVLVLVAVVVIVILGLFGNALNKKPNLPPAPNASMQTIVWYCLRQGEYTTTRRVGKVTYTDQHFSEEKFDKCLLGYEYKLTR